MRHRNRTGDRWRAVRLAGAAVGIAAGLAAGALPAAGQGQQAADGETTGRARAPVDLTGYWVSVVTEDWRFRMVTPPKGDYASVPLNAEGRRVADTWDASKDGACDAYGAAAIMRMPGRLHIEWADENTLRIETDAGSQTRLLHFGDVPAPRGRPTRQGHSVAHWDLTSALGGGGFGGVGDAEGSSRRWAPLAVTTTRMQAGWLRKNGVPYSENAVMTEHFMQFMVGDTPWFTVTTVIEDPTYLTQTFITSTNFKREPDGSKWMPTTCR